MRKLVLLLILIAAALVHVECLSPANLYASYFTDDSFTLETPEGVCRDTAFGGTEYPLVPLAVPTATPFPDVHYSSGLVDFSAYPNDGLIGCIDCPGSFVNHTWSDQWGFSFWIRRNFDSDSNQIIMGNMDNSFQGSWAVYMKLGSGVNATAKLSFAWRTDYKNETEGSFDFQNFHNLLIPERVWEHFVMTGNGVFVNVYLNNEPVKFGQTLLDQPAKGALVKSANPFYIGGDLNHENAFQGEIRDVFIYQQFLTASDVNILYTDTTVPTFPPTFEPTAVPSYAPSLAPTFDNSHLVASWLTADSFNGSISALLNDTTGHGNDIVRPTTPAGLYVTIPTEAFLTSNAYLNFTMPWNEALTVDKYEGYPWGRTFGISLWFRRTAGYDEKQAILGDIIGTNTDGSWGIYLQPSIDGGITTNLTFLLNTDHNEVVNVYLTTINIGNVLENVWHNLVLTGDGTIVNAYLDNIAISNGNTVNIPAQGSVSNSINSLYIGSRVNGAAPFTGEMKDIMLYSVFMDVLDVNILYNRIIGTIPTHAPTPMPTAMPSHSHNPTVEPTTAMPTFMPSDSPTDAPTTFPTTTMPTIGPTTNGNGQSGLSGGSTSSSTGTAVVVSLSITAVFIAAFAVWYYRKKSALASSMNNGDDILKHAGGDEGGYGGGGGGMGMHTKGINPMRDNIPKAAKTGAGSRANAGLGTLRSAGKVKKDSVVKSTATPFSDL